MSIRYWMNTRLANKENPTPKTLSDCMHYAKHYKKPEKVSLDLRSEQITLAEHGVYTSLQAYFNFEFSKELQVECSKQIGFFAVPLFFKSPARKSVEKANKRLLEIIQELENSEIEIIPGREARFNVQDFPYLLQNN